jgi:hypothetical protein
MKKLILTENQYNFLLKENEKSLEEFYQENNIDKDDLSYLGKGDFGKAYSIGDRRVLKMTSSKNEFEIAKKLENNNSPVFDSFAKIYKTEIIGRDMYIILEELDTDSSIEDLYYELQNLLDEQGLPIQYLHLLDTDELDISEELQSFIDDIEDINTAYRTLGIEASDIKPENLGYSENRKLKAFDIDNKQR